MSTNWPEGMPKEIRFGHITYTVHTDSTDIVQGNAEPSDFENMGGTFHRSQQIWVETKGCALNQVQDTLLHEVLHCCVVTSGAQQSVEQLPRNAREEGFVGAISTRLHGVLIENPSLVPFLTREAVGA